jgi:hypothetical protein
MMFEFTPVRVSGGRKFQGDAFVVGHDEREFYHGGHSITSSGFVGGRWRNADRYTTVTQTAQVWDPATKRCYWVTEKFVQKRELPEAEVEAARMAYVESTIQSTLAWCMSKSPNEAEGRKFARNCLRKHHPEMMEWIDAKLPDKRDVVAEVERILRWALQTRSNVKRTKASDRVTVRMALHALERMRVTKLEGFQEAWVFETKLLELPDYGIGSEHAASC